MPIDIDNAMSTLDNDELLPIANEELKSAYAALNVLFELGDVTQHMEVLDYFRQYMSASIRSSVYSCQTYLQHKINPSHNEYFCEIMFDYLRGLSEAATTTNDDTMRTTLRTILCELLATGCEYQYKFQTVILDIYYNGEVVALLLIPSCTKLPPNVMATNLLAALHIARTLLETLSINTIVALDPNIKIGQSFLTNYIDI